MKLSLLEPRKSKIFGDPKSKSFLRKEKLWKEKTIVEKNEERKEKITIGEKK